MGYKKEKEYVEAEELGGESRVDLIKLQWIHFWFFQRKFKDVYYECACVCDKFQTYTLF